MILKFFAARFPEKVLEEWLPLKQRPASISGYVIRNGATALLLLTAQISLAGNARWLLSPQDSAWENVSNWTPGGPPSAKNCAAFANWCVGPRPLLV